MWFVPAVVGDDERLMKQGRHMTQKVLQFQSRGTLAATTSGLTFFLTRITGVMVPSPSPSLLRTPLLLPLSLLSLRERRALSHVR